MIRLDPAPLPSAAEDVAIVGGLDVRSLWIAVLYQAYRDLWRGRMQWQRESAREWICDPTSTFDEVCALIDAEPEVMRERLLTIPLTFNHGFAIRPQPGHNPTGRNQHDKSHFAAQNAEVGCVL